MPTETIYDAIITGAGPAGLSAAINLAKKNWKVLLIDRAEFPRHKVCGGFIGAENKYLLEEFEVLDELLQRGAHLVSQVVLSAPNGMKSEFPIMTSGKADTAIALSRALLDQCLMEKAVKQGVVFKGRQQVVDAKRDSKKGCNLVLKDLKGSRNYEVKSQLVIWSNGINNQAQGDRDYMGISAMFENVDAVGNNVFLHFIDRGHLGINQFEKQMVNVCYVAHESLLKDCNGDLEKLFEHFKAENPCIAKQLKNARRIGDWKGIPFKTNSTPNFSNETGFYVGDSLAVVNPIVGGGISAALISGQMLAKILTDYDPAQLPFAEINRRYQKAWKQQFALSFKISNLWGALGHCKHLANLFIRLLRLNTNFTETIFKLHHQPIKGTIL